MDLDWTTFLLEIINFLALLWILKRFLYQPVLAVLLERRAGIERALVEAKETDARAASLQNQFECRLADWEREKAAERRRFEAEMSAERSCQFESLAQDLASERERNAAMTAHQQELLKREFAAQAETQARQFASKLLTRLASPAIEARLVDVFVEELSALPDDRLATVKAVHNDHGEAVVTSAFALDDTQKTRVAQIIESRLGIPGRVGFAEDSTLLAGLRVSLGAWQLDCSLSGELGFFGEALHLDD